MNLIIGAPFWLVSIVLLALGAAAVEDALRFRIANLTCGVVFVTALMAMGLQGLSTVLWQNAVICIAILAVGTTLFAAGWLGGGDVKLLAGIGLWFDLRASAGLLAAVFLSGGILGLVYIATRRLAGSDRRSVGSERRVPYGLAIVFGALLTFGVQLSDRTANPHIQNLRFPEGRAAR